MKNGFKYAIIPTIVTCNAILAQDHRVLIPDIQGEWWQIAGNPGLGEYTDEKQQPVDFGI
ncbi:hypothetical protein JW935_19585 [candidate division KSB1 bacterium]|nr:hypothetical protein [candidate division KSB1 bacterium]